MTWIHAESKLRVFQAENLILVIILYYIYIEPKQRLSFFQYEPMHLIFAMDLSNLGETPCMH